MHEMQTAQNYLIYSTTLLDFAKSSNRNTSSVTSSQMVEWYCKTVISSMVFAVPLQGKLLLLLYRHLVLLLSVTSKGKSYPMERSWLVIRLSMGSGLLRLLSPSQSSWNPRP
jgi:hypothetical protein